MSETKKSPKKTKSKTNTKKKTKKPTIQPEINIGLVGHVDHGKTTLTKCLSGKWTDTHSEELKRGITIRLGYANTTIYKCPQCEEPECYSTSKKCMIHFCDTEPVRSISLVDAPGHESLMATMLAGTTIMDGALLLIAANERCPQPQTREHLMALQMTGIKKIIVVQNKIDLVSKEDLIENYNQIKRFLKDTDYKDAPIIPISAAHAVNIDLLLNTIQTEIKTEKRDETKDPIMYVARSFDINKPGTKPENMKGGVLGGSVIQGKISIGDELEIRPGRILKENNQLTSKPLHCKVVSTMTGNTPVETIHAGGSVAIMTTLDPSIIKSDNLTGSIVGLKGTLPPVWYELKLNTSLLKRMVGTDEEDKVHPIRMNEILMLNVNSAATVGIVKHLKNKVTICELKRPICANIGARVTISRRNGNKFTLIGYGTILE